jgi:hypothetical protein
VGALLLLASLFLPWEKAPSGSGQVTGFSNLFADPRTVDGWSSGVGPAAALSAVLLAAVAAVAVARPNLSRRLALGRCALFAGYFVIAVGAGARFSVQRQAVELKGARFHYGYGAYLGIAGGAIALIAAGAMRRRELERFAPLLNSPLSVPLSACSLRSCCRGRGSNSLFSASNSQT